MDTVSGGAETDTAELTGQSWSDDAMEVLVQQFLDDWACRIMLSPIGRTWQQEHVNAAALELLTMNGVQYAQEEIKAASRMQDAMLIMDIVSRMPNEVRDNFESIAGNLREMASAVIDIRTIADGNDQEALRDVIYTHCPSTVGQEVVRGATLSASQEVARILRCTHSWQRPAERRRAALEDSQEKMAEAKQKLEFFEAELEAKLDEEEENENRRRIAKSLEAPADLVGGGDVKCHEEPEASGQVDIVTFSVVILNLPHREMEHNKDHTKIMAALKASLTLAVLQEAQDRDAKIECEVTEFNRTTREQERRSRRMVEEKSCKHILEPLHAELADDSAISLPVTTESWSLGATRLARPSKGALPSSDEEATYGCAYVTFFIEPSGTSAEVFVEQLTACTRLYETLGEFARKTQGMETVARGTISIRVVNVPRVFVHNEVLEREAAKFVSMLRKLWYTKDGSVLDELMTNLRESKKGDSVGLNMTTCWQLCQTLQDKYGGIFPQEDALPPLAILCMVLYTQQDVDIDRLLLFSDVPSFPEGKESPAERDKVYAEYRQVNKDRNPMIFQIANWATRSSWNAHMGGWTNAEAERVLQKWMKWECLLCSCRQRINPPATVTRGLTQLPEPLLEELGNKKEGDLIFWAAISSTTLDPSISWSYANQMQPVDRNVVFSIEGVDEGLPLYMLSQYPKEQELALPLLSMLRVSKNAERPPGAPLELKCRYEGSVMPDSLKDACLRDLRMAWDSLETQADQRMKTPVASKRQRSLMHHLLLERTDIMARVIASWLGVAIQKDGTLARLEQHAFRSWRSYVVKIKEAVTSRRELELELREKEQMYFLSKQRRVDGLKNALRRWATQSNLATLHEVVTRWERITCELRLDKESKAKLSQLYAALAHLKTQQVERAMKIMTRISEDQTTMLLLNGFSAWIGFHEDYVKNRELEEAVKKMEQKLQRRRDVSTDNVGRIMESFAKMFNSGTVTACFREWAQYTMELVRERKSFFAEDGAIKRLRQTLHRRKICFMSEAERLHKLTEFNIYLKYVKAWHIRTRVASSSAHLSQRLWSKREQLKEVQKLFRQFAEDLERVTGNLDDDASMSASVGRPVSRQSLAGRSDSRSSSRAKPRGSSSSSGGSRPGTRGSQGFSRPGSQRRPRSRGQSQPRQGKTSGIEGSTVSTTLPDIALSASIASLPDIPGARWETQLTGEWKTIEKSEPSHFRWTQ